MLITFLMSVLKTAQTGGFSTLFLAENFFHKGFHTFFPNLWKSPLISWCFSQTANIFLLLYVSDSDSVVFVLVYVASGAMQNMHMQGKDRFYASGSELWPFR